MSKNVFKISNATGTDAAQIQSVIINASRKMYLDCGYSSEDFEKRFEKSLTKEHLDIYSKNIDTLSKNEMFLVAKYNNSIVAVLYVEKSKHNILHAIYVLPEFQGKGVGLMLWSKAMQFIDMSKDTVLDVFSCNALAIKFYKKIGFNFSGKKTVSDTFRSESGVYIEESEMILKSRLKIYLSLLGIGSLICSRVIFLFIDDPEGPNLFIVIVLASILYFSSLVIFKLSSYLVGKL